MKFILGAFLILSGLWGALHLTHFTADEIMVIASISAGMALFASIRGSV